MMDERLNTTEDARPVIRKKCIVETVLEIIGGATVIEDGVEKYSASRFSYEYS